MSTRSLIGRINPDNSVTTIYCHWDGYPTNQFPILYYSYSNEEKLTALLELGSISYLEKDVAPPEGRVHTFDKPYPFTTVAYHRDRGDKWEECKPDNYTSLDEMLEDDGNRNIEYFYIFDGDRWHLYDRDGEYYYGKTKNGDWWYLNKEYKEEII